MREPGLISTTAIASVERAINAALRSDPATAARLSRHAGRLLAVHLTLPPLRLYALIVEEGVELYLRSDAEPDVSVTGNPVDLAALLTGAASPMIGGALRVEGTGNCCGRARPGRRPGSGLGRPAGTGDRRRNGPAAGPGRAAPVRPPARRSTASATRWAPHRRRVRRLALRRDVYEFYQDVDELRADVDRLDARYNA